MARPVSRLGNALGGGDTGVPLGEIVKTVWVTASIHPKTVVLTVENTGEKLTPQLVATLDEPFQRGSKRIRTDHAGVGLGLAIVSITQAHDGTLNLAPRAARRAPSGRSTRTPFSNFAPAPRR
jgi:signal transduction histidine kinase